MPTLTPFPKHILTAFDLRGNPVKLAAETSFSSLKEAQREKRRLERLANVSRVVLRSRVDS